MNQRRSRAAGFVVLALTIGACGSERGPTVGQSGSEGVPEPDNGPKVEGISDSAFRIVELGKPACDGAREPDAERVTPAAATLRTKLGDESAEFVILMKQEISLTTFPLPPTSRDDNPDDLWAHSERALAIAKSQACAVKEVGDDGGKYVSSFVLINAFIAELTAETAIHVSQRADVASVELSHSDTPPP